MNSAPVAPCPSPSVTAKDSAQRFHALDATRAFALMLGVAFHAAWSFGPPSSANVFSGPVADASGSRIFGWFFFTSHSFRMQLFFLIAGFFARLLCQKRGGWGFARNRALRIGVPLVVGWFILFPLLRAAWVWGGNVSGRNLIELPLPVLFQLMFEKRLMFVLPAQGGMFSLTHLWFLYYLLWVYVIVLAVRALLGRAPELFRRRRRADYLVEKIVGSPWALAILAVVTGLFLWRMDGWTGVDTPVGTPMPSGPVLLLYGFFFSLGWLIHRQAHLLATFARHWKWQVIAGLTVSLGCYITFNALSARGYIAGSFRAAYPYLSPDQITDWARFSAQLSAPDKSPVVRSELASLWQRIPEPARRAILQLPADPSPNAKAGVCDTINKLLLQEGLFAGPAKPGAAIPSAEQALALATQNRATLETLLGGAIIRDPLRQPSYSLIKCGYSLGYALMMWLLVFGTLGLFEATVRARSAAWRYVADSAYWIYLAHLPLVACLQVWLSTWNAPALVKFPLLLAIAFAVLFASYHYLVRSTFVGQLLNGQKYPFTSWPFRFEAPAPTVANALPEASSAK